MPRVPHLRRVFGGTVASCMALRHGSILLAMHDDPARYWQDLTDNYRRMSDGELFDLAERPQDLTEVAQQVLRDEMQLRKLEFGKRPPPIATSSIDFEPSTHLNSVGGPFRDYHAPPPQFEECAGDEIREYTWKTLLCDCESNEHAWHLFEALKRQNIESWVRHVRPGSTDLRGPQVYVAADQLEQARAVASQPIPQDIIDERNEAVPEFEMPICPRCGSNDGPVLESADPVNSWLCEACGAQWNDPESTPDDKPTAS